MAAFSENTNKSEYGHIKRSVLKNLLFSMLTFGLVVGLIFPPFARAVLGTEKAYSAIFVSMCIMAGLLVGAMNFVIFRIIVSRELKRVQTGMHHVNQNITMANVLEDGCENQCLLDVTSADIIGDITISFNEMTTEIFKRLELESETRILNEQLIKSVELEEVAETILQRMSQVVSAKGGLLYGGSIEKMDLLADIGIDKNGNVPHSMEGEFGPINQAINAGGIMTYAQMDGWDWLSQSTPLGTFKPRSILLVPLIAKQRTVGLIILACGLEKPGKKQYKKLEALRSFAAPFLDNAMLHQKITELAAIDDLTMILNRRFGLRRMREEFSRATRHGGAMSAVMIDIDHFKKFNDTFGHDAGDLVLKTAASILSSNLRSEDMVCRYGGEEFLIVLAGAGMNDGAILAERIRRSIETTEVNWVEKKLSITISIGIATYPVARASVCEELITFADKSLFAAKEFGRNQVAVFNGEEAVPFSSLEIGDVAREKRDQPKKGK